MNKESIREINHTVCDEDDGKTVSMVLKGTLGLSAREITRCKQFEDGVLLSRQKTCNEEFTKALMKDTVRKGDVLRVNIYEDIDNASEIVPSDLPIDIVYEDDDLILLNKPGDMVVHPSYAHFNDSLSNALFLYYERTGQKHVIRAIGRLDRETSGLIIFAKNRHSAAVLSKQNEGMSRRKEYLALASGVFENETGTIEAKIGLPEGIRMKREVMEEGKEAVTHYRVERQFDGYALIRLKLDTGRTHQIRVHMSHIGHPLLGDGLYGDNVTDHHGMKRAALHAAHLEFIQPITGERLSFNAAIPDDMKRLLIQ